MTGRYRLDVILHVDITPSGVASEGDWEVSVAEPGRSRGRDLTAVEPVVLEAGIRALQRGLATLQPEAATAPETPEAPAVLCACGQPVESFLVNFHRCFLVTPRPLRCAECAARACPDPFAAAEAEEQEACRA